MLIGFVFYLNPATANTRQLVVYRCEVLSALFFKRTDIRDAHDKYANQEVTYLLQRIESYDGLVILASNQRANIDEAFVRRFQAIVHFPMASPEERLEIWRNTIPDRLEIHADIDWRLIANRYELSGAGILSVAHYCAV